MQKQYRNKLWISLLLILIAVISIPSIHLIKTKMNEHQRASYFGHVFQDPMMGTSGDMSVLENLEIAYRRGRKHSPFAWGFKKSHREEFRPKDEYGINKKRTEKA